MKDIKASRMMTRKMRNSNGREVVGSVVENMGSGIES
jgi:hypothetical protein